MEDPPSLFAIDRLHKNSVQRKRNRLVGNFCEIEFNCEIDILQIDLKLLNSIVNK